MSVICQKPIFWVPPEATPPPPGLNLRGKGARGNPKFFGFRPRKQRFLIAQDPVGQPRAPQNFFRTLWELCDRASTKQFSESFLNTFFVVFSLFVLRFCFVCFFLRSVADWWFSGFFCACRTFLFFCLRFSLLWVFLSPRNVLWKKKLTQAQRQHVKPILTIFIAPQGRILNFGHWVYKDLGVLDWFLCVFCAFITSSGS